MEGEERGEGLEASPSAKPRRRSPPIPPNYVSLRQLQELRLKEEQQQEKRQREEEAAAVAKREAETKAIAATAKRDAVPKVETKLGGASSMASGRAKERHDGGQGHQWVAIPHLPAVQPLPLPAPTRGEGVAGRREGAMGGGSGKKGPADARHGGNKPDGKAKGKGQEKVSTTTTAQARTVDERGKPAEASSHGGKPEKKSESKAKEEALGDQKAESGSSGGPGEPDEAAGASPRGCARPRKNHRWKKGAGGRSAERSAPAKGVGESPPQGVEPESTGKPKPPGPRRADARPSDDSSGVEKATPPPAPPASAAGGRSGGELRTTAETKPAGLLEAHRRPPAVEVQGAAEQKQRFGRRSAGPRPPGGRGNGPPEQHGRVWVPKAAAASPI